MKKQMILLVVLVPLFSCVRNKMAEELSGNWNGYEHFLKTGESIHTLWAGKNTNVGTVTYGLDDNANFYVTYDCSASGWTISETHMFAGDKAVMPINKPGAPKIGLFPYSGYHNPRVSTFTYRVPLVQLPPCASPGFVVASHCVVRSPSGKTETAWAEGDFTFSDKGWGWYDTYYYDPPAESTILYGTACPNDTLRLFHLDITQETAELMLAEYVGNSPGAYDGAAFDTESGLLYFVKNNTELWINQLQGEDPSFFSGMLLGSAASGTCHNQAFYYVNGLLNTVNKVTFTAGWQIDTETVLDTIPEMITVNDIAINPTGDFLYLIGDYQNGETELIKWDMLNETFYSTSINIPENAQLAFGSNGQLYALAPLDGGGGYSFVYIIDIECGTLTIIEDGIILIEDPFSDLTFCRFGDLPV